MTRSTSANIAGTQSGAGIAKEVEGGNGWMDQRLQQFNARVASTGWQH